MAGLEVSRPRVCYHLPPGIETCFRTFILLIRALGNTCNIHLSIVMQWQVGESPCSVCRQSQEALTEQKFCEVWGFIISIQLYTLLDILTTRLCSSKVDFSFITEADMSLE